MLQVNNDLKALLQSSVVVPFVLIKIDFSSAVGGAVFITDAPREVVYNGDTYLPNGGLKSISPLRAEGQISRDLFDIQLLDPDTTYREILKIESTGVSISITAGFVDPETEIINSNFLDVYRGRINKTSWSVEDNTPTVNIQASGPLTKLQQIVSRTTNDNSQQLYHPGDTSLALSYDTQDDKQLKWGGTS
jgi:hypothetical protein